MAEFEIEAKVKPTLDNRQKRKVQEELNGMSAGIGSSGGGGSNLGLKRMNDHLADISSKLSSIRTALVGAGAGLGGAQAVSGGIPGNPATEDALGGLGDILGGLDDEQSETNRILRDKFDTVTKWLKIDALKGSGGSGGKLLAGLGSILMKAIGGISLGTIGTIALAGAGLVAIFDFVDAVGVLKQRFQTFKDAVTSFGDTPLKSLGQLLWVGFKNVMDPTGIGEAIAEKTISYLQSNFPNLSSMVGDTIDLVGDGFDTSVNSLMNAGDTLSSLSLPSIGFDVPNALTGLLDFLGIGGGGGGGSMSMGRGPGGPVRFDTSSMQTGVSIDPNIDLDLAPELDLDPKEIVDELEDMVSEEVNDAIDEIQRRFQVNI